MYCIVFFGTVGLFLSSVAQINACTLYARSGV